MSAKERNYELKAKIDNLLNADIEIEKIASLKRASITLRNLFEMSCNGCTREKHPMETWDEYHEARRNQMKWVDNRIAQQKRIINGWCGELKVEYKIQEDPRSVALTIGHTDPHHPSSIAIY